MATIHEQAQKKEKTTLHTLELPFAPPSLNTYERSHWSRRAKLKKEWQHWIWALCSEAGKKIPKYKHIRLTGRIYFANKHSHDLDNYSAVLWKLTLDGLVNANVIENDSPEFVTLSMPQLKRANKEKTVIEIEGEL